MARREPGCARAQPSLTMADIAREAGVSKITVSRALSGHPSVRRATAERVRSIASALGYKLNVAARNLRLQRTHTLGVVVEMSPSPTRPMSEPYPLALLGGIMQELTGSGYNVMLSTAATFARTVPAVDGVILLGQGCHDDAVADIEQLQLPIVVWGSLRNDHSHVIVGSDNVAGGALAAQRLTSIGRRNLVFLGDVLHAEIADRFDGFSERLAADGARLIDTRACTFTFAGGHDAMSELLDIYGNTIDGVFACSDAIAMGAIRAITERGRAVPEHVSVIGFDDSPSAAFFVPPLTTVRQDWNLGGCLLARKALALIEGDGAQSERLAVSLIVRES